MFWFSSWSRICFYLPTFLSPEHCINCSSRQRLAWAHFSFLSAPASSWALSRELAPTSPVSACLLLCVPVALQEADTCSGARGPAGLERPLCARFRVCSVSDPNEGFSCWTSLSHLNVFYPCVCLKERDASSCLLTELRWHEDLTGQPSFYTWHRCFRVLLLQLRDPSEQELNSSSDNGHFHLLPERERSQGFTVR